VTRALRLALVALLLLGVIVPAATAAPRRGAAGVATAHERAVVGLLNELRAERGLPPLALVDGLVRAARQHSRAMLARGVFAHELAGGASFDRRIRRFHRARTLGETIAWGAGDYGTPAGTVEMWMASPPHRAILLDRAFVRIGVGLATGRFQGVDGASVWTADLASAR
jgi:uncharacterized protein YkwD